MTRPRLCYHLELKDALGKDESTPDPYSVRTDCDRCRRFAAWVMRMWVKCAPRKRRKKL